MKKSKLRKLIVEYKKTNLKLLKSNNDKLKKEVNTIEYKYYHETGRILKSNLKNIT